MFYRRAIIPTESSRIPTHSSDAIIILPKFIKDLASYILGEAYCYEEVVERLNVKNIDCLKLGLSKGLGFGIVLGGCIVKIPQIFNIMKHQSTRGISFSSYVLETIAYFITIAYNLREDNPFSTWGESLLIMFQNIFILMLMNFYRKNYIKSFFTLITSILVYFILKEKELVSDGLMSLLLTLTIPVIMISRLPQIYLIYKTKSIGHLSFFTCFNYFLGTAGRVFTTIQEVDDNLILFGNILAFLLNSVLLAQMLLYKKHTLKYL